MPIYPAGSMEWNREQPFRCENISEKEQRQNGERTKSECFSKTAYNVYLSFETINKLLVSFSPIGLRTPFPRWAGAMCSEAPREHYDRTDYPSPLSLQRVPLRAGPFSGHDWGPSTKVSVGCHLK